MKPRTKYEKEVVRLAKRLPDLSGKWKCRAQGLIDYSEARRFRDKKTHITHFAVVTTRGGWQVIRHFYQYGVFRYRQLWKAEYVECMQHWIDGKGHYVFMALPRQMGYRDDAWCWGCPLTIKKTYDHCHTLDDPRYLGYDTVYYERVLPCFRYLPRDDGKGVRVDWMMRAVNLSPYWETIIKESGDLFRWCWRKGLTDSKAKTSAVKVARRHGQDIHSEEWCDLVDMLAYLGKDLHNPVYVAPKDLRRTHDEMSVLAEAKRKRMRKIMEERAMIRREREQLLAEERRAAAARRMVERERACVLEYPRKRKKFFGIIIEGQGIEIRALQSVAEFLEEGMEMHHCVFSNAYYDTQKNPHSLIMSAKKDGKRVETVEVDLQEYKIVQCRGRHNQNTEYHDTILQLVTDNMDKIRQANRGRRAV